MYTKIRPGKIELAIMSLIFLLMLTGIIASYINTNWYDKVYAVEDGFIEWMTVLALLLTCAAAINHLIKKKKPKGLLFICCMLGIFLLCFFAAGEEISWGQRLFHIRSSEYFMKNNSQEETNVHNLIVDGKKLNKIIFTLGLGTVAFIFLLVIPYLHKKLPAFRNFLDKAGVPVASAYQVIGIIMVALLHLVVRSHLGKQPEIMEFGVCMMFFLIVSFPYNKPALRVAT